MNQLTKRIQYVIDLSWHEVVHYGTLCYIVGLPLQMAPSTKRKVGASGECSSDRLPLAHTPAHNIVGLMHPGATSVSQRVLDMV